MAFYYVMSDGVNDGTATGDQGRYTSQQTGAMTSLGASGYYPTLKDVYTATTPPADSDFVMVASSHNPGHTATEDMNIVDGTIISVDPSNIDQYQAGATETSTDELQINNAQSDADFIGMTFKCGRFMRLLDSYGTLRFTDCTVGCTGSNPPIALSGGHVKFDNCILQPPVGDGFSMRDGTQCFMYNCTYNQGGRIIGNRSDGGNGIWLKAKACDFSAISSSSTLFPTGSSTSDGSTTAELHRCKLPTTPTVIEGSQVQPGIYIDFYSCTDPNNSDDNDAYYYEYHYSWEGEAQTEAGAGSTVRNATYDGTNGMSLLMETSGNAKKFIRPLRVKLLAIPATDNTSSTTYTVHFTCTNGLTDHDFWIEAVHSDNTDEALGSVIKSNSGTDILATPTSYTDNGDTDWTNPLTNTFDVSVTVPASTNVDNGVVEIYACLAKPSETVNVDYAVEVA